MSPNFSLFQPQALDFLKSGQNLADGTTITGADWFCDAMAESFCQIATGFGCDITMAKRRLEESRALWMEDLDKVKIENSTDPDHFKQAGFLTYWLRRRVVIAANHELEGVRPTEAQRRFIRYGNEICAFLTGFRIALYFEVDRQGGDVRETVLSRIRLDHTFLMDTAVLLHHKNVSPHALYLIYRALFHNTFIPTSSSTQNVVLLPK